MTESVNIIVSIINLFSLILGGLAIGLVFRLTRSWHSSYLTNYFFFLIFAVVSGFCDWIILNWVLLLVPGISSYTADSIHHIFWELIGFPSTIFALFFLIMSLNSLLKIHFNRLNRGIMISLPIIITLLSFTGYYFRLQEIYSILSKSLWIVFTTILPLVQLSYLGLIYFRSIKLKKKNPWICRFIMILFLCHLLWHILSQAPIHIKTVRHLIIFSYYLALFLPTLYLYIITKREIPNLIPGIQNADKLEEVFLNYDLTAREKELVFLLLEGKSNQEISDRLFISLQTVKNYNYKIYKKFGIKNRVELSNLIAQKSY
jgi:DNA-binding CsgD family transcriptional regulator